MWYVKRFSNPFQLSGPALALAVISLAPLPGALAAGPGSAPPSAASNQSPAATPSLGEVAGEVVSVEGTVFIRPDGKNSAIQPKSARPGDRVYAGYVVNTSSNGKIKLLMKDKSILDLGPSALFKVDHFKSNSGSDREMDVSMMYGTMRSAVTQKITGKGRFRVRTPTATMGVRGTEFVVKSDLAALSDIRKAVSGKPAQPAPGTQGAAGAPSAAKTEVTVLQGKVEMAKQDSPNLGSGKSASAAVSKGTGSVMLTSGMQVASTQGDKQLAKPVLLDSSQLKSLSASAKVQDNTFTRAIVIDAPSNDKQGSGQNGASGREGGFGRAPSSSGGFGSDGMESAAGEATREALASAIAVPFGPPVPVGDAGFAGTFGHNQVFEPKPRFNEQAGTHHLRVIVITE